MVAPLGPAGTTSSPLILDTLTDFEEFFACLYPAAAPLSWLIDGAQFAVPDEEKAAFTSDILAAQQDCRYAGPRFVERWARFLDDDWCTLVGCSGLAADPPALVRAAAGQPNEMLLSLAPSPEVLFCCVDGVLWEFYAHDERLLARVQEALLSRTDLRIDNVTLGERA